jgi:hypothetical protein
MFTVTYEIITQESAEAGEAEERGTIDTFSSLREALEYVYRTRTDEAGGITCVEADCSHGAPRWITVYNGMEFRTGAHENRSLHLPDGITPSSAIRIARLMGAR